MKLDISNKEVLKPKFHPFNLQKKDLEYLKTIGSSNKSGKSRICSHKNINEKLHEMFIYHQKNYYVRPHRHFKKSESILILEGKADLVLFDDFGKVDDVIELENFSSGKTFYFRIDLSLFHMLLIKSKYIVFHEVTSGPFNKKDTEYAKWSPSTNSLKKEIFLKEIQNKINDFKNVRSKA